MLIEQYILNLMLFFIRVYDKVIANGKTKKWYHLSHILGVWVTSTYYIY